MGLVLRLATALMRWGSHHPKFGHRDCYTESFARPAQGRISEATRREFEDGASFFLPFGESLCPEHLAAKDVLDLGCGHGGRTLYYLISGNPRSIVGLEISHARASIAKYSVARMGADDRISFVAGLGEELPFEDCSFDLIISYDVFEHVGDLRRVLRECHRALRWGGRLCALFPPYYGPRAHHLDFITTLPFLHYFFSPDTLVRAANHILRENPQLRDEPLPEPAISYCGRRVLPRLNGTTERIFRRLVEESPFEVIELKLMPFGWTPGNGLKSLVRAISRACLKLPWPFTRDVFIGTICCILQK
jgi:SAM-dependent methyltransferase